MDIQEKQAFEAEFEKTDFYKMNLVNCFCFIADRYVWDEVQAAWEMWQAAKAQAVPECSAIKDVIGERQRQISHEFYSTEHDDEYKSNELLRAAVCYAENVLSRGWIHRSSPNSGIYQSEEVPDFWPWDQDFWKPKSPRKDLVRAAALLIAEIERIDRAQEQTNESK